MLYNEKLSVDAFFGLVKTSFNKETGEIVREEMDASKLTLKGKNIIILCGNNTKDPMRASVYAGHCFNWLKGYPKREDVEMFSIFYKQQQPLLSNYQLNPHVDYVSLAKTIFEQVLDSSDNIEDVAKKLGDITFFGHSIGGHVMNEIVKNFGKMMQERGFSEADINKAYSSMVFIGYAPYSLVKSPINRIYMTPIYDSVGSAKLVYTDLLKTSPTAYSNTSVDVQNLYKTRPTSYATFIDRYRRAVDDADATYFGGSDYLVAIPNLLYDDGIKEDHNLAGVVEYPGENPYKTTAGKIATGFMRDAFTYSVSVPRNEFSIGKLFLNTNRQNTNLETKKL